MLQREKCEGELGDQLGGVSVGRPAEQKHPGPHLTHLRVWGQLGPQRQGCCDWFAWK